MAKRANGEGTLRKRQDGRWEAIYYSEVDKKRHSIYGKTQKEVKDKLKAAQAEMNRLKTLKGDNMPMAEWFDIWLTNYTSNIKPATLYAYRSAVRSRLKPSIGDIQIRNLKTNDIQNMYIKMKDEGLTPKTIKDIHGVLHKALDQAVKIQLIYDNVSNACVLPRNITKEINPLNEEKIAEFLALTKGDRCEDIFYIALFTGMRQGEILGLTWDCINLNSGMIRINKQLLRSRDGSGAYFGSPKNGKERVVYAPITIIDRLKRRKELWDIKKKFFHDGIPSDLVFTDSAGYPLKHQLVYKHYKRIARKIKLPDSRFHDLRHSFAVISLQNGIDIKTLQETLGHQTASFTLQRYAHATDKMKQESANRIESFIKSIPA